MSYFSEKLGKRLLESKNDNLVQGALLCFICSGSLNNLVDAWVGDSGECSSPDELQVSYFTNYKCNLVLLYTAIYLS